MPVTKFKKGNKYAFTKGHKPHNKDQTESKDIVTPKILRSGTLTHSEKANSKKSSTSGRKTGGQESSPVRSTVLRKRKYCDALATDGTVPSETEK